MRRRKILLPVDFSTGTRAVIYRAFRRATSLPTAVDGDKANATMKDGMLTITLPKSKTPKGHEIKIAAA